MKFTNLLKRPFLKKKHLQQLLLNYLNLVTMVSFNAFTCKWINSIDAFPSHTTWHGSAIINIFIAVFTCKTWITGTLMTISCWRAVSLDTRWRIAKVWTNFTIAASEGRSKNEKLLINSARGVCSWATMFCEKETRFYFSDVLSYHWRTKLSFFMHLSKNKVVETFSIIDLRFSS